ncbi:13694_t:CDS:2 [Entrophospora sp. SA101]|nr:13694_t:CDS:2 [Entrophospora sp. SA101]
MQRVRGLAIAQLTYSKEEVEGILSCSVPGDLKNNGKDFSFNSTGIDSTSEEIDIQSDDDDKIEVTREGEQLEVGFELGGRRVHPAEDNLMKWSLESLFIYELESPTFLGSDVIFTGAC